MRASYLRIPRVCEAGAKYVNSGSTDLLCVGRAQDGMMCAVFFLSMFSQAQVWTIIQTSRSISSGPGKPLAHSISCIHSLHVYCVFLG